MQHHCQAWTLNSCSLYQASHHFPGTGRRQNSVTRHQCVSARLSALPKHAEDFTLMGAGGCKHKMHVGFSTWYNPVEVAVLHLLVVLILLQAEGGVGQVPVYEACLLGLHNALQAHNMSQQGRQAGSAERQAASIEQGADG